VVASETYGDGITFTTIHMPLVRTPMIAPTNIYRAFPPARRGGGGHGDGRAAPAPQTHRTPLGTAGSLAYTLAPRLTGRAAARGVPGVPGLAAARGDEASAATEMSALSRGARAMARVLPASTGDRHSLVIGIHW